MIRYLKHRLYLLVSTLLLMVSQSVFSAEKQVADLVGEDRIRYDQFRRLLNGGQPEEFYAFTQDYEKELKTKGYMMLYYKLKTNEGFFALGHRQLFRAMQYAEELDKEVREAGASDYFYLATGLFAEIYNHSLDKAKNSCGEAIAQAIF